MNYLEEITEGKIPHKLNAIIYGSHWSGKTTLACDFPNPIMIDIERGSKNINVKRIPYEKLNTFSDVMGILNQLNTEKHKYETVIIDTLDGLELWANAEACQENGWKSVGEAGFGKGYDAAYAKFIQFFNLISKLNEKMHVVLVCHSQVKAINDPTKNQEYHKHGLKLRDKTESFAKEQAGLILFCTQEVNLKENQNKKAKAYGDGTLVMFTQGRPSHEGKNRYNLPYKLPVSYEALKEAIDIGQTDDPKNIKERITESLQDIKDPELKKKVLDATKKANDDSVALSKILNKLNVILSTAA